MSDATLLISGAVCLVVGLIWFGSCLAIGAVVRNSVGDE